MFFSTQLYDFPNNSKMQTKSIEHLAPLLTMIIQLLQSLYKDVIEFKT